MTVTPIHLLMRFSDPPHPIGYTIKSHQSIIRTSGSVWLGKLGRALGARHIERINEQCRNHTPTFLYLVQRLDRTYDAHRGRILEVTTRLPLRGNKLVPSYYDEDRIRRYVSFWAKLCSIEHLDQDGLSNLHIASSLFPVLETLAHSMAGMFVIKEGRGMVD